MHRVCAHTSSNVTLTGKQALYWFLTMIILISVQTSMAQERLIRGRVTGHEGIPVEKALVRFPAHHSHVLTLPDGTFELSPSKGKRAKRVTAWKEGYYIAGADLPRKGNHAEITLLRHPQEDCAEYQWLEPLKEHREAIHKTSASIGLYLANNVPFKSLFNGLNARLDPGCVGCHGKTMYEEWFGGAHAAGNHNLRFMSMYNGTDIHGNKSSETRYHVSRDYGASPLPAIEDGTYYGPGYKLDFPYSAGNCATCHLPAAAIDHPYDTDPNEVTGINSRGSHCDFCHKISGVTLDPVQHIPYENRPGVLSYQFLRPEGENQIFFGPYDDVDAGTDVYLPLISQSEYCAGCHDASFWSVPVYKSYSEWYQSPYRQMGITCQNCHMSPNGHTTNFARNRGGLQRDPATIATHRFEGAMDSDLLQNAVSLHVELSVEISEMSLRVVVENDQTGHHVPTDSPLRQVILLVQAEDVAGRKLDLIKGPSIPEWGGTGDPTAGYYSGLPGQIYAKVLEELWTGESPSGSYWMPTRVVQDNRIRAFDADTSIYLFDLEDVETVQIDVKLIYRRAPKKLMDRKSWDTPDMLMNRFLGIYHPNEQELMIVENLKP